MRECDSVTSDVNTIYTGRGRQRGDEDRGCVHDNVDSTTVRRESMNVTASGLHECENLVTVRQQSVNMTASRLSRVKSLAKVRRRRMNVTASHFSCVKDEQKRGKKA